MCTQSSPQCHKFKLLWYKLFPMFFASHIHCNNVQLVQYWFPNCNEAFALQRFTFHQLRCNFALVHTWNHIYMHYALCSVHNGAQNIICISLWTGTGSNFQAYWLDSHPPSHLHFCLCTFRLYSFVVREHRKPRLHHHIEGFIFFLEKTKFETKTLRR